jgi:hypothetical protein
MTLEYYPATSLARFFSDEGVGSAVDCAPQRKKVSIRSGVRIPVEQWSSPTDQSFSSLTERLLNGPVV